MCRVGLILACLLSCQFASADEQPIRVLIYSGENNHNWRETTPELERILKRCPTFTVDVTEEPQNVTAEQLANYDVIVSNWNNFRNKSLKWPDPVREAFLSFVRDGGGHVMVHAGGSSFNDWEDYHKIAACWGPKTGHGPVFAYELKPTGADHPITKGMPAYEIRDELWHNTSFPPQSTTLMTSFSPQEQRGSGKEEPILTVNRFGQGRCVNFMSGHDAKSMKPAGFQDVLLRSVEWAKTGAVKITPEYDLAGSK